MIVIPMAGASRRFAEQGYALPKFMLPLASGTVFAHAVGSFAGLFADVPFLFVVRRDAMGFVEAQCRALGIAAARIVALDAPTAGQAETVERGLEACGLAEDGPVTIFNIDTFRRGFAFPRDGWFDRSDGYLEVFRGAGENWSYVLPAAGAEPVVVRTAEKQPISALCCNGLYHFARAGDFRAALDAERARPAQAELYVAPLYNHLIARGMRIHYREVPAGCITFCGVPTEYEAARADAARP